MDFAQCPSPPRTARIIRTARLDVLPLRVEHAEEMAEVLSDPALHAFIGGAPATPDALRSRYERLVAGSPDPAVTWWNWVLRRARTACLVGTVQATVTERRRGDRLGGGHALAGARLRRRRRRGGWSTGSGGSPASHASSPTSTPDHRASAAVATAAGLTPTDQDQDGEVSWERPLRP